MHDKVNPTRQLETLIGAALIGCTVVGILGILFAFISLFHLDSIGAGLSLTAAGLAFGLLTNAVLRD